jgi:hypothetical protein
MMASCMQDLFLTCQAILPQEYYSSMKLKCSDGNLEQ